MQLVTYLIFFAVVILLLTLIDAIIFSLASRSVKNLTGIREYYPGAGFSLIYQLIV